MKTETKGTITAFLVIALCIIAGIAASAQNPVTLQPKAHSGQAVSWFTNIQGYKLPSTLPDTTKVYRIGDTGSLFVFRTSKKTGQSYKLYLKQYSDTLKTK